MRNLGWNLIVTWNAERLTLYNYGLDDVSLDISYLQFIELTETVLSWPGCHCNPQLVPYFTTAGR